MRKSYTKAKKEVLEQRREKNIGKSVKGPFFYSKLMLY